jgi:hypothetical protein
MVEGLFEMIRSGEESKVQELLAMIHANAPMSSVAAKVEASLRTSEGSQKRKRMISPSAIVKDDISAAGQSVSDVHMDQTDLSPRGGWIGSESAASTTVSQPTSHRATSSHDTIGSTGHTSGMDDQPNQIFDHAKVRALLPLPAYLTLFSYKCR